jgi:hypothetical protein
VRRKGEKAGEKYEDDEKENQRIKGQKEEEKRSKKSATIQKIPQDRHHSRINPTIAFHILEDCQRILKHQFDILVLLLIIGDRHHDNKHHCSMKNMEAA